MKMNRTKTVLITGANKGIGFEVARQLGNKGFKVLLGSRDEELGRKAEAVLKNEGVDTVFLLLDVTNQDTINNAVGLIEHEYGYLDVLINNAGIFMDNGASPSQLEPSVLKETFETNFFGIFAMIKAMIPLLKKSTEGRIVNVSSGQGSRSPGFLPKSRGLFQFREQRN